MMGGNKARQGKAVVFATDVEDCVVVVAARAL